jgi:predicted secreted hydrolase
MKRFTCILLLAATSAALKSAAGDPLRTEEGFRIPTANHAFTFPRDHGSHPDFRIEWWYITGHLRDDAAQRYGFQATFFRYAMHSRDNDPPSAFGTNQLYMAHMALTDIDGKRFIHEERFNRDGWDAKAATHDLDLRNGNWTLTRMADDSMMLQASVLTDVMMNLKLEPKKPFVFFGKDRLSQKGADPSACSWYITHTRLKTTGQIELDGRTFDISGESWMDHEISSSQLAREQVGWDWLSVRFDDGQEMMVYILRDAEGNPDPHSTLAWIDPEGIVRQDSKEQGLTERRSCLPSSPCFASRRWRASSAGYPIGKGPVMCMKMTFPSEGPTWN